MSKFIDSFKREVGKNAGKWVSNKLFGDKHATPIKIIRKREDDPHAVQHAVERALKNSGSTPYFPTPSRNDALDSSATSYKPIIQYQPNDTPNTKDPLKEIEFDLNDEKGIIVQLIESKLSSKQQAGKAEIAMLTSGTTRNRTGCYRNCTKDAKCWKLRIRQHRNYRSSTFFCINYTEKDGGNDTDC